MTVLVMLDGVVVERRLDDGTTLRALDGVSLAVNRGETLVVMGRGGSGKSTLAAVLAGAVVPTAGRLLRAADGSSPLSVPSSALVLQRPERALLGETVAEDVGLALRLAGADHASWTRAANEALAVVGLPPTLEHRSPFAASGGEQRRVAIAGAVASGAGLVVLDEPGAGLDAVARHALYGVLAGLRSRGATLVIVTHDAAEAAALGTRVVVLDQGRIAYDGAAESVLAEPQRATALGVPALPAAELAGRVADAVGVAAPRTVDEQELLAFVCSHAGSARRGRSAGTPDMARLDQPSGSLRPPAASGWLLGRLRADQRPADTLARLIAFTLLVGTAFAAPTLAGACIALLAAVCWIAGARVPGRVLMPALVPLSVALGALVVVQVGFGAPAEVPIVADQAATSGLALAGWRSVQVLAMVLCSLALTHRTDPVELANALALILTPLRLLRIPVQQLALVLAMGLAFVPTMTADLRDLELALAARTGARRRGWRRTVTDRMLLLAPLLVHAMRRARHLGEALHVRGYRPGGMRRPWRPLPVGARDLLPPVAAAAVFVVGMLV